MSTRIYVPGSWTGLRDLVSIAQGSPISDPPRSWNVRLGRGYAVTDALRQALPGLDDEQLEHYAMTEAAQASLPYLDWEEDVPRRRLVLAVDVDEVQPVDGTLCEVQAEFSLPYDVAAWLVDTDAAAEVVARAAEKAPPPEFGDTHMRISGVGSPDHLRFEEAAEACLDHELAWYAATEVDELLKLR